MDNRYTVAAIDVGSNSIKVLIARKGASSGLIETLCSQTIETRISQGISSVSPRLSEDAIKQARSSIVELIKLADSYQPCKIQIVATSAVRDASNGHALVQSVAAATGHTIRILAGQDEATYIGKGLACDPAIAGINSFVQMDIGGGSLELIRFNQGEIEQAISLQLGAVRLSELFITSQDLPISNKIECAIRSHVQANLLQSGFNWNDTSHPIIATGGAFAVARALIAGQKRSAIESNKATLSLTEISALKQKLTQLTLAERKALPNLPAARADIIPTALITIEQVLQSAQHESLIHSFYNLRYGIVAEMLSE